MSVYDYSGEVVMAFGDELGAAGVPDQASFHSQLLPASRFDQGQVAGLGGFYGTDTSDMMLRDSNNGAFEVYDISNNTTTSAASLGAVGLEWQVSGFGDLSSRAGETDMLMSATSRQMSPISCSTTSATIKLPAMMGPWAQSAWSDGCRLRRFQRQSQ